MGLSSAPARARGDEAADAEESLAPTAAQTKVFLESGKAGPLLEESETDLHAAQAMPHTDLDRGEALELAEAVFSPELESPAGIFDELEPERYVSDYGAIVSSSNLPEPSGQEIGETADGPERKQPLLLESSLPLRIENASGEDEAVDLRLQRSEGELQPQNPLTEVGIPAQLGEGVSFPGTGVTIEVAGAPEDRAPTNAERQFAFYPEVAKDTDLIVAPTPLGVEMMTDIRSAEAPTTTTYTLSLPPGASLRSNGSGGAEVVQGGRTTLLVPPPTATDSAGNPVPVELRVEGEALRVEASPEPGVAYPILVDPDYITEGWYWSSNNDSLAAWSGGTSQWSYCPVGYLFGNSAHYPGLDLTSPCDSQFVPSGTEAYWRYWVPRGLEDLNRYGTWPTSWVYQLYTQGVFFLPYGNSKNYPALVLGVTDPNKGWNVSGVHYGGQGEMANWGNSFTFTNAYEQTNDKGAQMSLVTYENESPGVRRDVYVAEAIVLVADSDAPRITKLNPPAKWMNNNPEPIDFAFEDQGLGVRSAGISYGGTMLPGWGRDFLCPGTTAGPCPREISSGPGHELTYYPANLPTGKDVLTVTAGDVMWGAAGMTNHTATGNVVVKVDHTAPELSLSGSLTEQGSLGTRLPAYALRVNAKDGIAAAPQSGVKKVEVLVDGSPIVLPEQSEWEPNCQTENCRASGEWTMSPTEYPAGSHEVKVIATDAVGNTATRILQVELHPPAPTLSLSGTMTEQGKLGSELPSYSLHLNASALAESPTATALPTYSSSFGASGTGNGQLSRPGAMAVDAEGNLWVADSNANRVEEFNERGTYLGQFGTKGSGNGQLNRPTAVAITADGNLWVTDSGNRRVEEFSPAGVYLAKFGSAGTGNSQFAGYGPEAIAIDYHGNVWIADTYGGRLEKFNESGTFIRSVATNGKGSGQLLQPDGIAIAPGGNVYVTDWEDDKVAEYGEGGAFIRQFGSEGKEAGQLLQPTGIAIDGRGDIWVADQNNGRVEEFNQAGEYLGAFGSKGTGAGQFELGYPTGIVADQAGDIWVTDAGNDRVERWRTAHYFTATTVPTYAREFGAGHQTSPSDVALDAAGRLWTTDWSTGTLQRYNSRGEFEASYAGKGKEAGKLESPLGLAISGGHVWVSDSGNNRIEEFGENGAYLFKFGEAGTANGKLSYPSPPAIDPGHHIWVADAGNNRVQEFTEAGAWVRTIGTSGTGKLLNPQAVAIGPGNTVFVADYGDNRVVEFSETGTFIRQIGGSTAETGQLTQPIAVWVDSEEHVWVVERGSNRVKEYSVEGVYLGQFGSTGAGPGQAERPGLPDRRRSRPPLRRRLEQRPDLGVGAGLHCHHRPHLRP